MNFAQTFGNSAINVFFFLILESAEETKTLKYPAKQQKSSIFSLSRK